ncbi:MAG: FAD:protein FMN transferase [Dongiaceae bacterium]
MAGSYAGAVSRRRFIGLSAAAAGVALRPLWPGRADPAPPRLAVWRGVALGADAQLQIHHPDPAEGRRLIGLALAEVARLEAVLSLYRPDSALVALNRSGRLDGPPLDLLRILAESAAFHRLSGGAFDVTVQPLWDLYAAHFADPAADPAGPPAAALAAALARVGQDGLRVGDDVIDFARPGMAVTLNGIGQGYVTDRVTELLRREGVAHALVDMGETRAIGDRPGGGPWAIGLEDPRRPGAIAETVGLADRAVATSGGYGTPLDLAGRFNHIFDPATGATSSRYLAVSVVAPTATEADALSTAFCLMPPAAIDAVARTRGLAAHVATLDGSRLRLGAA